MRPVCWLALGMAVAACGGGGHAPAGAQPAVADQLRAALGRALGTPAPIGGMPPDRTPLRADVTGCTGPRLRLAGTYRCTIIPRHARHARTLIVEVDRTGTWQTTIPADLARPRYAAVGVWGAGLHR